MSMLRLVLAIVLLGCAPAEAAFHGSNASGGTPKTVLNMQFGADQFANISVNFAPQLSGSVTPANLSNAGFPAGVLPNGFSASQTALPSNYFGHYSLVSTGISSFEWIGVSIIVYSGGQQVYPGLSSGFGTSIGNTTFLNNGPWNVEFAFGDTVATVQNSATTPGLVELVSSDANGFSQFGSGGSIQVHNVANLSPTTVWTISKINNTTIDLQGSSWNSSMVPATGNPGTAAEAVYNPGSLTPFWEPSLPIFGTVTHSISNLILCKTGDLAAVQGGQNVSAAAISSLTTLKPKWLRFMDMIGVQGTSGQFQYLPTLSSAQYTSSQWLPPYYGGTTAGTGDAYTVSGGPSSPASGPINDGEVIQFKADRSSVTKLATLQVNGRTNGPQPILRDQGQTLAFNLAGQPSGTAISSISGSGTVATATTSSPHGFTTGQLFITNIGGNTPSTFNGGNVLATATGASTFTYANTTSGSTSVAGTFTPQVADGDILNLTYTASNFAGGAYTLQYYVNLTSASVTGTVSGKILTVSAVASGRLTPGQKITGSGLTNSPVIVPYGNAGTTGTGGTGTYALTQAPTGTTTITGTIGSTGANCANGVVNSIITMVTDLSCVADYDATLGGQGYIFTSLGGTGLGAFYAPAVAQATPSATITLAGGLAEIVTPSFGGGLTANTLYTAQYRALENGWEVSSGPLLVGIPIGLMKEFAQRSGAGVWYNVSLAWTPASASALGTYLATNLPGIPVAIEIGNELWNTGQAPNHYAQNLGASMGFTAVNDGVYYQSVYGYLGWMISNVSEAVATAYVSAGGTRSNLFLLAMMSGADGQGCSAGCVGGQTGGVQTAFNGVLSTPTPASFSGTITPNTNGLPATLTVTGISGVLYPGFQINGAGVTAGTHIASCLPATSDCNGNGTYQLDTAYGSTVGPVSMTATNVIYSAVGGPGATPTSQTNNTFPNRPIDYSDAVGYATYWTGAIVGEGSGSWTGAQAISNPFFQAAANYVQGVATSNNTLIQSGLNTWSADANGQALANMTGHGGSHSGANECGFLSSPSIFGFCFNAPNAVITGSTGGTATLTVTGVASGTVTPGMIIAIGGSNTVPVIQSYGTNGTTGTGGTGTYALSVAFTPGNPISNTTIGVSTGAVQGWVNIVAAYDSGRPVGKSNLGIMQYEGALQEAFCPGSCVVGNIFLSLDSPTLTSQFVSNGWSNLDVTYGYPGFGAAVTFSGTTSGSQLTVTGTPSGPILQSMVISGAGITNAPIITSQASGTTGGAGVYNLNTAPVGTTTITSASGGSFQTAHNVISLFLGYVNSQQYYNDALFFYQSQATINASRSFFSPAQYGIEGTPGQTATTGAPQWGMYPGDLSTPPLQNYQAQVFFNTH